MHTSRIVLAAALLTVTALSGCASSGNAGDGAFNVTTPGEAGGAYTFEAKIEAENYTWDVGDHLTTLYGKTVSHAYDFKDGEIVVILRARTGTETKDYSERLTLGTGTNAKPTFLLEGSKNWTVEGETVRFSAARSTDPESDPLRFSWSCNRFGDAVRSAPHSHGLFGKPFATAPAGSVTAGLAAGPLPSPDKTYTGDLCDALGSGTKLSDKAATIEGSFAKTGVYDIYLIATDPVHPTTSGSFRIVVTKESERPNATFTKTFSGTFQGGAGGTLQGLCNQDPPGIGSCDEFAGDFRLPLSGLNGKAVFTLGGSVPPEGAFEIKHGNTVVAAGAPGTFTFSGANLNTATNDRFDVLVTLESGVMAEWSLKVEIPLDMDPLKVY